MQKNTVTFTQVQGINVETLLNKFNALEQKIDLVKNLLQSHQSDEKLMTADEVADYLKVSRATICNWQKSGLLDRVKVGNLVRYRKDDVYKLAGKKGKHSK